MVLKYVIHVTVTSFVKITNGDNFSRIAQIRHFVDFVDAEKATEVIIATPFTNQVHTDVDHGLSWVDTSNKESNNNIQAYGYPFPFPINPLIFQTVNLSHHQKKSCEMCVKDM